MILKMCCCCLYMPPPPKTLIMSSQLSHWLAVLRPGRSLHLPAGADVVGDQLRQDGLPAAAPRPAALLRQALSLSQPRSPPHSDLARGVRLALHQVSANMYRATVQCGGLIEVLEFCRKYVAHFKV